MVMNPLSLEKIFAYTTPYSGGAGGTTPTSDMAPANATTTVYASSLVIKASVGILRGIVGYNSRTSPQFIQIHNAAAVPADASVPVITFYVAATSDFSIDFGVAGRFFSTGIVVCNSSTGPTKTLGQADCWFDCQYV